MSAALVLTVMVPALCAAAALPCRRAASLRWTLGTGTALTLLCAAAAVLGPAGAVALGGLLRVDGLSRVLVAMASCVGALATADSFAHWRGELWWHGPEAAEARRGVPRVRVYFFWQQLFLGSLLLAALSGNLGVSWVAIELTTVTSAVLVGFEGGAAAVEAAWKYVILCSVGLALALLTTILFYALAGGGGLHALDWGVLQAAAGRFAVGPAKLAYLFALVGFGTKAGLAPLHTWLPDAHSEAPAPVSALLSGVLLALVLCTLVRVAGVTAAATGPQFPDHLLLGAGLLSIAVATPFLLVQEDLKRLLAYSSIEQVGLLAVAFGLHSPLAAAGAVVQMVVHALTKSGLFFAAGHVAQSVGSQRLNRLRGLGARAPALGAALLVGAFTLGGLPPFGMFFSELAILRGTLAASPGIGIALLVLLAAVFGGLLFYAGRAVWGGGRGTLPVPPTATGSVVLAVSVVMSVVVGLWAPGGLGRDVAAAAALVVGGRP